MLKVGVSEWAGLTLALRLSSPSTPESAQRRSARARVPRFSVSLMMLWLVILPALTAAAVSRVPRSCGTCDPSSCAALPAAGCTFRVMDACGCCELCAAGAGEPCGVRGAAVTRCGPGLECVKAQQQDKTKLKKKKSEGGVCVCKNGDYEVCGSDGVEYRNVCELKAAERQGKSGITVHNKGKCAKGEGAKTSEQRTEWLHFKFY